MWIYNKKKFKTFDWWNLKFFLKIMIDTYITSLQSICYYWWKRYSEVMKLIKISIGKNKYNI